MTPERAEIAPLLALALDVWNEIDLEPGEAAVVTGSGPLAGLLSLTALWRGATPVVRIGSAAGEDRRIVSIVADPADPEGSSARLRDAVSGRPGFAAVDVSGSPEVLDLVFEATPYWGRIVLAAEETRPLILDWYNNVHRKGVRLRTRILRINDAVAAPAGTRLRDELERASRLLADPEKEAACRAFHGDTEGAP